MQRRFFEWTRPIARHVPALLPSSCALCGMADRQALCDGCRDQFFGARPQRCHQCARPLAHAVDATDQRCGQCVQDHRHFDATIVAADYVAPVDHLVLALKFGNRLALAPLFAHMLREASQGKPAYDLPTVIAPVPLGSQRLAERGFNQALEIAKPLAQTMAVQLIPTLIERTRDTLMQAQLPTQERHKNMRNAFVVATAYRDAVKGAHVGIVDDVMTTGESLNEVAATLKRHGAARVTNLVFARTPPK